jgi:hypothetical protein
VNDTIQLTFAHLSILGTIGVFAAAAVAFVTSRIVRAVGWTKPYSDRQRMVLEWAPAIVFGVICIWLFPFVYSQVVGPAEDPMWHVVGFGMGIVGGLGSKGFYALAKKKLAPAWEDGATDGLRE